jgi:diguanylate cyclase (GGDEF)-like protein/putative nucleotidyltransferase with HDIG domain
MSDSPHIRAIDAAIERLGPLPVFDRALMRVRELAEDPESTTQDLVQALQADANLAANLLRHANSAHAARPVRVTSLQQGVTLLGRRAVGQLVLEAQVCSFFERAPGAGGAARGQLGIHAAQVGTLAGELARRARVHSGAAHLAGLLHDLGKLVLPLVFGEDRLNAIASAAPSGPHRIHTERAELGVDHAFAGARFAVSAGLDEEVADAVRTHHGNDGSVPETPLQWCVQAADAAVALFGGHAYDQQLLEDALGKLGLDFSIIEELASSSAGAATAVTSPGHTLTERIARLEQEAQIDDLTGLLNRRYWSMTARQELETRGATVLICDVDHFKRVNDSHGHHVGDCVLVELARVLEANGIAGRLGGDEFALLADAELDPEQAMSAVLEQADAAFRRASFPVSVSIGAARADGPGRDVSALLRAADEALYAAKRGGRATFRLAA